MSWRTYLALILCFDYNLLTHEMLRSLNVFPEELESIERVRKDLDEYDSQQEISQEEDGIL